MKLYLHIGTEKTGTTTVQKFFHMNRKKFAAKGILYPSTIGSKNHIRLPLLGYDDWRKDNVSRLAKTNKDEDFNLFCSEFTKEFKSELALMSCQRVLCSSEHLQSQLKTVDDIYRLKKSLQKIGFVQFEIILYLRHPAEIAQSLYSEAIKCGSAMNTIPKPIHHYFGQVCNHKKTIQQWGEVFGVDSLNLRLFDKEEFLEGDFISDFLHAIGLNSDDSLVRPSLENRSLSKLGTEVFARINSINLDVSLSKKIRDIMQKYFTDNAFVMGEKDWNIYSDYYFDSNEWVRKNFFPQHKELFNKKWNSTIDSIEVSRNKELDIICKLVIELSKS